MLKRLIVRCTPLFEGVGKLLLGVKVLFFVERL